MIKTKGWLLRVLPGLILLTLFCAQSSCSRQQSSSEELKALRKEIETIKENQAAIQKDLQEVKNVLARLTGQPGAAPRDIALDIGGAPFKGDKSGKVVLVEFSDYQ
jgi:septal ring factor EnvC (AmiA/AmiB activator)